MAGLQGGGSSYPWGWEPGGRPLTCPASPSSWCLRRERQLWAWREATGRCQEPAGGAPGSLRLHFSPSFAQPIRWVIHRELI